VQLCWWLAANAQTTSYTLADVAKHATAADCWMVLNTNKVYNFTPFISMHPGGSAMVPLCGKDGTQAFNAVPHSANAVALETPYFIGNLVTAPVAISVKVAPANATVNIGGTAQFTPTVANSSSGVAWTVTPSSLGTISASGLFTAVGAGGGTVTATSMQDMTKSASASITVNTTPTPPPTFAHDCGDGYSVGLVIECRIKGAVHSDTHQFDTGRLLVNERLDRDY
jgi:hypothetical protein